ncbi:hypothetical protein Nepgr_000189 [Nepenthes gracilis]|uniref:DUF3741 domain-containing protein n=1 Tax=Nepenthes gracilis TaxID=150966 RepID=A0AAD3P1K4_NEPGR|nr:hypothetical protein Nepgr_000189 [Nepenthes gracilis]
MKFTFSSLSYSSSSSFTNFADKFSINKSTAAGCISGILRRIFCSGSLPTYPCDQIKESDQIEIDKNPCFTTEKIGRSVTPNIVARLMGLDSMPDIDFDKIPKFSNSVSRSKSMSSMDLREETEKIERKHRRAETTFSFRQTHNDLAKEGDDFYVLSFDNGGELGSKKAIFGVSGKGQKQGRTAERQRMEQRNEKQGFGSDRGCSNEMKGIGLKFSEKISRKADSSVNLRRPSQCNSSTRDFSSAITRKESSAEIKVTRTKRKKEEEKGLSGRKVDRESESENSSPVSVLDHGEITSDPEVTTVGGGSRSRSSISRTNLTSKNLIEEFSSNYINANPISHNTNEGQHLRSQEKCKGDRRHHHADIFKCKVCWWAETEALNSDWPCKWRMKRKMMMMEDLGAELGFLIFEQLINEVIHQLRGLPIRDFGLCKVI